MVEAFSWRFCCKARPCKSRGRPIFGNERRQMARDLKASVHKHMLDFAPSHHDMPWGAGSWDQVRERILSRPRHINRTSSRLNVSPSNVFIIDVAECAFVAGFKRKLREFLSNCYNIKIALLRYAFAFKVLIIWVANGILEAGFKGNLQDFLTSL